MKRFVTANGAAKRIMNACERGGFKCVPPSCVIIIITVVVRYLFFITIFSGVNCNDTVSRVYTHITLLLQKTATIAYAATTTGVLQYTPCELVGVRRRGNYVLIVYIILL